MKRIISISLIIIVNLFFLAHEVLPHHHHEGVPHFLFLVETCPQEDSCSHSCCNENNSCEGSCALDQDVDVLAADENDECRLPDHFVSFDYTTLYHYALIAAFGIDLDSQNKAEDKRPSFYLLSYQSVCAGQGFGLRAPPAFA